MATPADTQPHADDEYRDIPLIGTESRAWLTDLLSTKGPNAGLEIVKKHVKLKAELCDPLMLMVDHMGLSRLSAHKGVLQGAKRHLLSCVQQTDPEEGRLRLERLLNNSFRYLAFEELREIPLAAMEKLDKVPPVFLKQLTDDKDIFRDLPRKVKRQVWEFDKKLLQTHALPFVGQYKYEMATIMRALAADEFLPATITATQQAADADSAAAAAPAAAGIGARQAGKGAGAAAGAGVVMASKAATVGALGKVSGAGLQPGAARPTPQLQVPRAVTRKILRKGSKVVQGLKEMVGQLPKIYHQIIELCMVKFRDSDSLYVGHSDLSYCTLRVQLLMALHDDTNPVAAADKVHKVAWTIDAGITNGQLTPKHLQELGKWFTDLEALSRQAQLRQQQAKADALQDVEESAGNVAGSLLEPLKVLGDVSMVLRDPSAVHLLCASALQMMEMSAQKGELPSSNAELVAVLRMLHLAADSKAMLRNSAYKYPVASEQVLRDILPLLGAWHLDFMAHGPPSSPDALLEEQPPGGWGLPLRPGSSDCPAIDAATRALRRCEVSRRLTQAWTLERLLRGDLVGGCRGCKLLARSLNVAAIQEGYDFAGSLAMRMTELVKAKKLVPQRSCLWREAMDGILVKAVDAQTQVHEEVLRLLLASHPQLDAPALDAYLTQTLEASKRSRKRTSKKQKEGKDPYDPLRDFGLAAWGSDAGSDIGSDGWPGILDRKTAASDGVRSVYSRFATLNKLKNKEAAPALYAYLGESLPSVQTAHQLLALHGEQDHAPVGDSGIASG